MSKKAAVALLAAVFALTMMVPALSFAQQSEREHATSSMTGLVNATTQANMEDAAVGAAVPSSSSASAAATQDDSESEDSASESRAVGECTATIRYMEYLWEEDPDIPTDEGGRALLGTYEVTGLHVGDVLHAWDYVLDIPGHFFYDGWPLNLTVTGDPEQDVMTLIYVKMWDCEYTVNYYKMDGADLTASNWADALKPEGVTFTKIGSETFGDQIYDKLVKGDAYEYQVDGMYVIDSYPAEIRVGLDPDENVINVLYTASYATGPDSVEVPDEYVIPGDTTTPDDAPMPDDSTFDKDDIIGLLPDGALPGDEIYDDFLGTTVRPGELVVTDEMLQHPVNKDQAIMTAMAYETGLHQSGLAQTGDIAPWIISGLVVLVVVMAVLLVWLARRGHRIEEDAS